MVLVYIIGCLMNGALKQSDSQLVVLGVLQDVKGLGGDFIGKLGVFLVCDNNFLGLFCIFLALVLIHPYFRILTSL